MKYLLGVVMCATAAAATTATIESAEWHFQPEQYEGRPLLLRYPVGIDYESLKPSMPNLLTITHTFTKTDSRGLPEKGYNKTLEEFDVALVQLFQSDKAGVTVLVETFGGKRMYYKYVSNDANINAARDAFARNFPSEKLEWEVEPDATWRFLQRYRKEYGLHGAQQGVPGSTGLALRARPAA